eukprot:symbB.v1.2.000742.t1/scaffold36.1/size400579/14
MTFSSVLQFECFGVRGPLRIFLFRLHRVHFALILFLPVIHCVYAIPRSKVFQLDYLTNAVGSALLALSNGMSNCLLPFNCLPHPNSLFTVARFDDIICDFANRTYQHFVVLGVVSLLVYLSFICLCLWLLLFQLPRRLLVGDIRFVRCCNFLVSNFRPGGEVSVVLLLCRAPLASLLPLVPSVAGKFCFMNIVLIGSLFLSTLGQPWRSSTCNNLDLVLLTGMLMLLDLASYLIPELEIPTMATVCVVTACLMVLATVGTVIVSVLRFALLQSYKPYRIYISSHQRVTGCYARMLKMEFDRRGIKAFLEDDAAAPLSLQELLLIVSQDTDTVVFLATREALGQKTCVGEMVIAQVHNVHTVLLAFPSFIEPSEIFIADSGKIIPGIVDLVSLRIGLQEIEETFRWIGTLPTFRIAETMTHESVAQVLSFLLAIPTKDGLCDLDLIKSEDSRKPTPDCLIMADLENLEAAATAMVLRGLMMPLLLECTCEEVEVLTEKSVPAEVMYVFLVCSDGCFETPRFANWLLQLRSLNGAQVAILPVIAESGFRFPSLTFHSELLEIQQLQSFDLGSYAKIIRALFGELWFFVGFTPQSSSAKELHLRAEQAHALLLAARPLAERLAAVEAEKEVQDQDEETQQVVSLAKSERAELNSSQLQLTMRSDLNMTFMAEIYQMYFNPTVHEAI